MDPLRDMPAPPPGAQIEDERYLEGLAAGHLNDLLTTPSEPAGSLYAPVEQFPMDAPMGVARPVAASLDSPDPLEQDVSDSQIDALLEMASHLRTQPRRTSAGKSDRHVAQPPSAVPADSSPQSLSDESSEVKHPQAGALDWLQTGAALLVAGAASAALWWLLL